MPGVPRHPLTVTPEIDLSAAVAILLALFFGGVLKGAVGAGVPVVAVPVMAAFFDPRLAVVIMAAPNLFTNLWQIRSFRGHHLPGGFSLRFAVAGGLGALVGTTLLAWLPVAMLSVIMALVVIVFIALRLTRPQMRLGLGPAQRLLWPAGVVGGVLQGAVGISAPVSVSFLSAMRLERGAFIATISAFFAAMSLVQLPMQYGLGLMTPGLLVLSAAALLPVLAGMPAGEWLARHLSARAFDRILLTLLGAIAAKLLIEALFGI